MSNVKCHNTAMLLYKFKSPSQIHHALEIIKFGRLFCAPVHQLNDLEEGAFNQPYDEEAYSEQSDHARAVEEELARLRVCSLSEKWNNSLLWAHYADGFTGVAIEIEVPAADVKRVRYIKEPPVFPRAPSATATRDAKAVAICKLNVWRYEAEWRILTHETHYQLPNDGIKQIIVGTRTAPALKEALWIICRERGIQHSTVISMSGILTLLPTLNVTVRNSNSR